MAGFERAQLPHEAVVLRVRDLRGIQHVILIFVVSQFVAHLVDSLSGFNCACCAAGSGLWHSVHYRKTAPVPKPGEVNEDQALLWNRSRIFLLVHAWDAPASIAERPTLRWL